MDEQRLRADAGGYHLNRFFLPRSTLCLQICEYLEQSRDLLERWTRRNAANAGRRFVLRGSMLIAPPYWQRVAGTLPAPIVRGRQH